MVVDADPHRELIRAGPVRPDLAGIFGPSIRPMRRYRTSISGSAAWVDIMKNGMAPEAAAAKAFKQIEAIFAKYPIAQG